MPFSPNQYKKLESLQKSLQLSQEDLCHAVEKGFLQVSIRLPSRCNSKKLIYRNYRYLKRFVSISPQNVRAILKQGSIELQKIISLKRNGSNIRLAEKSLQRPISVATDDLLVLETHEKVFRRAYIREVIIRGSK